MDPEDVLTDGRISIDVGAGMERRDVLKRIGAAGALLGTAGCLSDSRRNTAPESPREMTPTERHPTDTTQMSDTPNETSPDTSTRSPESLAASRHPVVAPPGWDADNTRQGTGLTERRAVLVLQNIDNPIFIPMTVGFHDALYQIGWTGKVTGPTAAAEIQEQSTIIEETIGNMEAGDTLVTTILNSTIYNEAIQSALENDIVVVNAHTTPATRDWNYDIMREEIGFTYTSPVTGEEREMIVPHIGINEARGGAAMAAEAYERLRMRMPDQDEYTVLLTNDLPDNAQLARRVDKEVADEGTAQRYFEARDDVTIYDNQVVTPPQPPQIAVSRNFIVDTVAGEDVDAIVSSAFWSAVGAGDALAEGELEGPMVIGSFDVIQPLLDAIQNGRIDFTVGQDLYGQGYRSAKTAWTYLERGIPMNDLEWGVSVWDESNVEFGLERQSWQELQEWQQENYDHTGG